MTLRSFCTGQPESTAPLHPCNMLGGAPAGWDKGLRATSPQGRIVGPECVSSRQAVLTSGLSCVRNCRRSVHGSTLILIALCCISRHRLKSFSPNNSQDASLEGRKGRGAMAGGVGRLRCSEYLGRRFYGVSVWCDDVLAEAACGTGSAAAA